MCNGRTKRAGFGFFDIDVNPLMVACGLGKHIDLFLRDLGPWGHGHRLTNTSCEFLKGLKCFHRPHSNQLCLRDQSRHCLIDQPPRLRVLSQFGPGQIERQWCAAVDPPPSIG